MKGKSREGDEGEGMKEVKEYLDQEHPFFLSKILGKN